MNTAQMTQQEIVLAHLRTRGPLTQKEAADLYGLYRLAARVYELRGQGHPIESTMVEARNRNGQRVEVARYALAGEQQAGEQQAGERQAGEQQEGTHDPQQQRPRVARYHSLDVGARFRYRGLAWDKETEAVAVCRTPEAAGRRFRFGAKVKVHPIA